jgi:hypothetical protein
VLGQEAGNGCFRHPEGAGHIGGPSLAAFDQFYDQGLLLLGQLGPSAAFPALGAGVLQALPGPLPDHGPFELGEAAQHLHEHPAGGGAGLNMFRQALEGSAGLLDLFQDGDKVLEGPAEAVELPHRHDVAFPELVEEPVQLGPVPAPAGRFFLEDFLAAGRFEGLRLDLYFLQVATGHAGVADTHKSFKNGLPYVLIMQDVFETVKAANGGEGGEVFHKRPFMKLNSRSDY